MSESQKSYSIVHSLLLLVLMLTTLSRRQFLRCDLYGMLQSDIVHQSVYELVHSEDREELQRQLMWNSFLPAESAGLSLQETLQPDRLHLLERSFTVRFRCLLDNTSGFLVSEHAYISKLDLQEAL